MVIKSIIAFYT